MKTLKLHRFSSGLNFVAHTSQMRRQSTTARNSTHAAVQQFTSMDSALQLVVAVTVFAAALPRVIQTVKPLLLPIRCRTCMGATTNLCRACASRGKVGGLFTAQPLTRCQTCQGTGRVTCSACKGKGMVNSWLWQTDMSGPQKQTIKVAKTSRTRDELFYSDDAADQVDLSSESFPYPQVGDSSTRKSFRELVKEQQREWRI